MKTIFLIVFEEFLSKIPRHKVRNRVFMNIIHYHFCEIEFMKILDLHCLVQLMQKFF